jgi:hypothetical protein
MMADENPGRALGMVRRVEQMCDFIEHPAIKAAAAGATPVTMPPEVGALGFDIPFWAGFGTVGLWAALDALREGRLKAAARATPARETASWRDSPPVFRTKIA